MKAAIRYYSKTGNTKKLAYEIGQEIDVPVKTVDQPIDEPVDVLFLGSAVYAAGIANEVKEFIHSLKKDQVKTVVNFSTAALLPSTYKQVKQLVEAQGIKMEESEFHCRGQFKIMHKGKPDQEDLRLARAFAKKIVTK